MKKKNDFNPEERILIEHLALLGIDQQELTKQKVSLVPPIFSKQNPKAFFTIVYYLIKHLASKQELKALETFYPAYTSKDQLEFKKIFLKLVAKMHSDSRIPLDFQLTKDTVDAYSGPKLVTSLRLLAQFVLFSQILRKKPQDVLIPCLDPFRPPHDINALFPSVIENPQLSRRILIYRLNQQIKSLGKLRIVQPCLIDNSQLTQKAKTLKKAQLNLKESQASKLQRGIQIQKFKQWKKIVMDMPQLDIGQNLKSYVVENPEGGQIDLSDCLSQIITQIQILNRQLALQKLKEEGQFAPVEGVLARMRSVVQKMQDFKSVQSRDGQDQKPLV